MKVCLLCDSPVNHWLEAGVQVAWIVLATAAGAWLLGLAVALLRGC
jgi:hypothetical protein